MVIGERKTLNFPGFIQKVITRTVGAHRSCKFCTVSKCSRHCGSRQAHHTMMYLTCIFPLCSRLLCASFGYVGPVLLLAKCRVLAEKDH